MRRPSDRAIPLRIEAIESRELLTTFLPILDTGTYYGVVKQVKNIMSTTLFENHNLGAAATQLTRLSGNIPFGHQQLAPVWVGDLGIYNAAIPNSGRAAQRQMLLDLNNDIINGIAAGEFRVVDSGYQAFYTAVKALPPTGPITSSADSVTVANDSRYDVLVTAHLVGTRESITREIPNTGSALFDFGSNSGHSISIDVTPTSGSSTNSGTIPHPFHGGPLYRPFTGYAGRSVTLTQADNFFVVNQ